VETLRPLTVRFSARASRQLLAISEYIHQEAGDGPVERLGIGLREAIDVLRYFPEAGRQGRAAGTREWVIRRWPYVIVYEIDVGNDELMILGVFHCRQDRP
jgi:plasmid stabilization system protein ParE